MKNKYSILALVLVFFTLIVYRFKYPNELGPDRPLQVTTWDALGYYMYLPGTFIYNDLDKLEWFPAIDEKYGVSGGHFYQGGYDKELDVYVFKYLGGLAVLQLPFFTAAHQYALHSEVYAADGFSLPYQVAVCIGALFYTFIGLIFLRKVLLHFFDDKVSTITIILIGFTTNLLQYVSIDSAMSHSYIFFLYPTVIWATIKWHQRPTLLMAATIGWLIGAATICRPTEALMILIPILWNTQNKEVAKAKWSAVWSSRKHIWIFILFGLIGILPQLVYWQVVTGFPIYQMGSKWFFLTPWFRVLFGINNGWFIYTPIAIIFILGMFFMKDKPFQKSVWWFCGLTIWIVIAWSDWRYGATYSCRALSQSLGVFALPLACVLDRVLKWRFSWSLIPAGIFLIYLNLTQIHQYNSTVLHYHDMNWKYYGQIFLDKQPNPLELSLLDNHNLLSDESGYRVAEFHNNMNKQIITGDNQQRFALMDRPVVQSQENKEEWFIVETALTLDSGFYGGYIHTELIQKDSATHTRIRIANPVAKIGESNNYEFHIKKDNDLLVQSIRIYLESGSNIKGHISKLKMRHLIRKD